MAIRRIATSPGQLPKPAEGIRAPAKVGGWWDVPKVKGFPADSVQCDQCGGIGWSPDPSVGCGVCDGRGWLTPRKHQSGRRCANEDCDEPIPPDCVAIYCCNDCASADA